MRSKILFILFLATGILFIRPNISFAACSYRTGDACPSTQGTCINGTGILCCSDENSCISTDPSTASWISPSSNTEPEPETPDICKNQASGDCTNPQLPQACLFGLSYSCCNTASACRHLSGVPTPHANPNEQPADTGPSPSPSTSDILCQGNGISTAIGCIPILGSNGQTDFLSFVLKWAVGVGGGIAFLLILYGGFMVMTSAGNPERLKAGQELITSAISGLILLIFSVFILKFIGVDILGLCKFGFGSPC